MSKKEDIPEQEETEADGVTDPFKKLFERFKDRNDLLRHVHVIVNPASGPDQPILKTLNAAFKAIGADWDLYLTKEAGDARRLAKEAVAADVDAVAVYGGDGTVMEVASGLAGSGVRMAILPGGTANVMANELHIPIDFVEAAALAINPDSAIRKVDMGKIGDHTFMLRAGLGFEAAMVEGADRDLKNRLGRMAYTFSALQALADPVIATYYLTMDGEQVETSGITCIIANSGNVGLPGFSLAPNIDVSDGLLDVIVVTPTDLSGLVAVAASVVAGNENAKALQHWQAKEITVRSDPKQRLQIDGEMVGETPVTVQVLPEALNVIVPADVKAD